MTHTESTPTALPTFANGTRVVREHDGATGTITTTEFMRSGLEIVGVRYDEGDEVGNRAGEVLYGHATLFRTLDEARFVVVFGECEDEYSIGEFGTEDEALIAAARHCLQHCVGQRRMPDPFRIDVER